MIPLMQNDLDGTAYFLIWYFLQERKEMLPLHTISFSIIYSQWIYHLAINVKVKQQNRMTGNLTIL